MVARNHRIARSYIVKVFMRSATKTWPIGLIVMFIAMSSAAVLAQTPTPLPTPRPLPPEFFKRRDAAAAFDLGRHLLRQGKVDSLKNAGERFADAERLYLEIDDRANAAAARLGIGAVKVAEGDTAAAAQAYERAISILRTEQKPIESTLARLGFLYDHLVTRRFIFKYDKLEVERPPRGYDRNGDRIDPRFSQLSEREHVRYFNQPFVVYIEPERESVLDDPRFAGSDRKPEPVSFYRDVLKIWQRNGVRSLEIAADISLMDAWSETDAKVAAFYGKRAINKYQELRREFQRDKPYDPRAFQNLLSDKYRTLADLLIGLGRFAEADDVLRMLKEEEFFDFTERDATEIERLKQRVRLTPKERELIDRYLVLANRATEIGEEYRKLEDTKAKNEKAGVTLDGVDAKKHKELGSQVADINAAFDLFLRKELAFEIGSDNQLALRADRELQRSVTNWGAGTATLYTVVTENRYRVILTTPTVQIDGKTDIPAAELNKKIYAFRDALQDPRVDPRPLGKQLFDILLKPIEQHLSKGNIDTLVWSLDGNLRYIPMAALSPDGKKYLVETYQNVTITPRTRDRITSQSSPWKVLGMGTSAEQSVMFPDQPGIKTKLDALPGVKQELQSIVRDETIQNDSGLLVGRRFIDAEFTRQNLTDSLASRKFSVVHFASHFRLGKSWTTSYLVMGGGKLLSLEEMVESPAIDFRDVELVTLSACNTALTTASSGIEVDSLAEAVVAKNGKAVLATLWNAYDESTLQLMTEFYRNRVSNPNATKSAALRESQLKLIASTDLNHPFYWSAVTLIGNWR